MTVESIATHAADTLAGEWLGLHKGLPGIEIFHEVQAVSMFPTVKWGSAARIRLDPDIVESWLQSYCAKCAERSVDAGVWTTRASQPEFLPELLSRSGFHPDSESPIFHIAPIPSTSHANGCHFETDNIPWTEFYNGDLIHPLAGPLTTEAARFRLERTRNMVLRFKARQLLAFHGEKLAGSALVVPSGSCAGLFDVAVHHEFRGSGIGKSIVRRAFELARDVGCSSMVSLSTTMGQPLYRSVGMTQYQHATFWKKRLEPA